jgi:hypothetical protein
VAPATANDDSVESPGIELFRQQAEVSTQHAFLLAFCDWASEREAAGRATLVSKRSTGNWCTLRVFVPGDMSLVIGNCGATSGSIQMFASMFNKRAPRAKHRIEELTGLTLGQGTAVKDLYDGDLLRLLTEAYDEAAAGAISAPVTLPNEDESCE